MDITYLLIVFISLAATIFVLMALGQLFGIHRSLERLVVLAESWESDKAVVRKPPELHDDITKQTDEILLSKWKAGDVDKDACAAELKKRGYYMEV